MSLFEASPDDWFESNDMVWSDSEDNIPFQPTIVLNRWSNNVYYVEIVTQNLRVRTDFKSKFKESMYKVGSDLANELGFPFEDQTC
jgi:hypothetical protein